MKRLILISAVMVAGCGGPAGTMAQYAAGGLTGSQVLWGLLVAALVGAMAWPRHH